MGDQYQPIYLYKKPRLVYFVNELIMVRPDLPVIHP